MPFATVKLQPGVKALATPTLLSANIVASNMIRFKGGLPEKLGGWVNLTPSYYQNGIPGVGRELCAWMDLNNGKHIVLAGGVQAGGGFLYHISPLKQGDWISPITPIQFTTSGGATFTPASGSPLITVSDPVVYTLGITTATTVQIATHVAVGGLVLYGNYPIKSVSHSPSPPNVIYTIQASANATNSTAVTTPCVAQFAVTSGSAVVTVTLPNHGFSVGSSFQISLPTTMTGAYLTLSGIYTVLASPAPTTNTFAIDASWGAQATVSGINEGNLAGAAYLVYWNPQIAGLSSPSGTSFPSSPGNNPAIYPNVSAEDWSLANFGQNLIANAMNGPLFYWNPLNAGTGATASFYAQIIPNAPALATGFFIAMPQQMIVAYGAAINQGTIPATYAGRVAGYAPGQVQDPMQVAWCDAGSLNTWIASASNQAGSFRLTRGSKIVGGIQGPQQAMLFTDVGVWVMAYIGYPDVWGFNEIAQGCGLIAKDAAGVRGPQVFWMSLDGFWAYAQGAVQKLPCDVWDIVFTNLNLAKDSNGNYLYLHHIRFAANSGFDEVAWHFPSAATLIQQTTTSSTAVGVSVLNLASTVGVQVGMTVADVTNPAAIGYITTVTAVTASTVTLRSPVTSPGVSSGDTIYFNNAENDSYVKLNTTTGEWDYALSVAQPGLASPTPIQVTAWLDANIYGHPLSSMMNPVWMQLSPAYVQPYSMLVQHEESPDAVTQTPSGVWGAAPITWMITTGYFQLAEAETFVFVDYVLPDFKWRRFPQGQSTSATVQFTLYVADYPDDPNYPAVAYGPYTVTNVGLPGAASPPVPNAGFEPRCRGRYFYAVIWGNDLGSFARLGGVKFRFQPDGRAP